MDVGGGAVSTLYYDKINPNNLNIVNTNFNNNIAIYGAAIINVGSKLTVDNCNFTNNSVWEKEI